MQVEDREVQCFLHCSTEIPEDLKFLEEVEPHQLKDENCRIFRIMSPKDGDRRVVWNALNLPEIKAAKKVFTNLIKQGMIPFRVGTDGNASSEKMAEFDSSAEEVIFLPMPMVTGG